MTHSPAPARRAVPFRFSTHIFHPRLFVQGIARLRVIGLATAICSLILSVLIPVCVWMAWDGPNDEMAFIPSSLLCVPLYLTVLLAPFFFYTVFSFLRKRKDCDAYHAIPYTRTCVYTSFALAALSLILLIQLGSAAAAGILWAVCPHTAFLPAELFYVLGISFLGAAFLGGVMTVAAMVTGTAGTCLVLFGLFAALPRFLFSLLFYALTDRVPTMLLPENHFLAPMSHPALACFPGAWFFGHGGVSCFHVVYTLVVTIALFVLGGVLYQFRASEMAGVSAPGKKAQTLFRTLFALAPLCMAFLWPDAVSLVVLTALSLVACLLYELVTAKSTRAMLKALPKFGYAVGAAAVFAGVTFLLVHHLNAPLSADRIDAVAFEPHGFGSYEEMLLENEFSDDEDSIALLLRGMEQARDPRQINNGRNYRFRGARVRMKSGIVRTVQVRLAEEESIALDRRLSAVLQDPALDHPLPPVSMIKWLEGAEKYTDRRTVHEFYETLRAEFDRLTPEEQAAVFGFVPFPGASGEGTYIRLYIEVSDLMPYGTVGLHITEAMPETYAWLLSHPAFPPVENETYVEGAARSTPEKEVHP